MFEPHELMRLTVKLVAMLEIELPAKIAELVDEADPDFDTGDHFSKVDTFVEKMRHLAEDDENISGLLDDLERSIDEAKEEVKSLKSDDEGGDNFFTKIPSATLATETTSRSLFSDVDE